ncbi:eukaryotic aspartyl protease (macronuclear) [Tetrahymena thermophila SB210]|uniref:Eukaryotic aspartyl protease n=1 Tax=Tetrahymena thermophila (strain SB210) TaxID=312017 RepID=Q240W7_TETTS|nr:eukaryotic aspartyl protease [Tetrahymena thermophila SB210]EAS02297.2 eukaryotic aspartyl protease [Tetrahymena thermophila SB210]|eukprot:XP_001022542.2 eukaryotic aspartyl protease [Tetrahymena thermophila SB210]
MLKINNLIYLSLVVLPLLAYGQNSESNQNEKIFEIQLHHDSIENLFYVHTSMGKEVQESNFKFLVDTGSKKTWVQNEKCKKCVERNNKKITRKCEEDICKNKDILDEIKYGTGQVTYYDTYDYLVLDDLQNTGTLTLKVDMGHVVDISDDLLEMTYNGLIGLEYEQYENYINPFVYQFKQQNKIDNDQVFSINFRKHDASLILGGIKQSLIPQNKTDIQYISIDTDLKKWQIQLQDFKVGNYSILNENQRLNSKIPAILEEIEQKNIIEKEDQFKANIDSGTNYIVLDQNLNEKVRDVLINNYNFQCKLECGIQSKFCQLKCKNPDGRVDNFPPLSFTFIDQNNQELVISIPPKQYVEEKIVKNHQNLMLINFLTQNNTKEGDKNNIPNELILGYPFLQNQYVIFDINHNQIGFVQLDPLDYQICQTKVILYILIGFMIMSIGYSAAKSIIKKIF